MLECEQRRAHMRTTASLRQNVAEVSHCYLFLPCSAKEDLKRKSAASLVRWLTIFSCEVGFFPRRSLAVLRFATQKQPTSFHYFYCVFRESFFFSCVL